MDKLLIRLIQGKLAGNWVDVKPFGKLGVIQKDTVTGTYKSFHPARHPIISKDLGDFARSRTTQ